MFESLRLTISGVLEEIDEIRGPLSCQAFSLEDLQRMDFEGSLRDEYKAGSIHAAPTFLFISATHGKVEWGIFDNFEQPTGKVYCLQLLKQ
jgi:hypothetical protein